MKHARELKLSVAVVTRIEAALRILGGGRPPPGKFRNSPQGGGESWEGLIPMAIREVSRDMELLL